MNAAELSRVLVITELAKEHIGKYTYNEDGDRLIKELGEAAEIIRMGLQETPVKVRRTLRRKRP